MKKKKTTLLSIVLIVLGLRVSYAQQYDTIPRKSSEKIGLIDTASDPLLKIKLPQPYATQSVVNNSQVIGWKDGRKPIAPAGFTVTKFAEGFQNPRWIYIAPNGDV